MVHFGPRHLELRNEGEQTAKATHFRLKIILYAGIPIIASSTMKAFILLKTHTVNLFMVTLTIITMDIWK